MVEMKQVEEGFRKMDIVERKRERKPRESQHACNYFYSCCVCGRREREGEGREREEEEGEKRIDAHARQSGLFVCLFVDSAGVER